MVTRRLDLRGALALAAVALVWGAVLAMHAVVPRPAVAIAGAFDLTVSATLAVYLIAVRGGHLPRAALGVTAALGALGAKLVLARTADAGHAALAAAATLELAAIALVAIRMRRARRGWRASRVAGADRIDALDAALAATGLPRRVAAVLATELAVVGCALGGWKRARPAPERFTAHRTNGWSLYAGVFVGLTLAETPAVHLALVAAGLPHLAWLATALSLYGALWLIGDLHALRHGGVIVGPGALELRLGVRWRGSIPRAAIARIERGAAPDGALDASILGANVVLHLTAPVTLHGLLGRRRTASVIALSIDEPERFVAALGATPTAPP